MKVPVIILIVICTSLQSVGQTNSSVFLNSSLSNYSKTDFSVVDSLNCWFYVLLFQSPSQKDSVKSIGELTFQRKHPVGDTTSEKLYKSGFLPIYTFQIFDIRDSIYCFKKSHLIKAISSCIPPEVGGDIVIFGKFIFLNLNVCLHCRKYDNGIDYCRPIINKIFSSVDKAKADSLKQIVGQFPIKGQVIASPL
jgi:hypothetical protein